MSMTMPAQRAVVVLDDLVPFGVTYTSSRPPEAPRLRVDRLRAPRLRTRLKNALPCVVMVGCFTASAKLHTVLAAQVVMLAFMLIVPGLLLLDCAKVRPHSGPLRVAYCVATSVVLLMMIGLAASVALPGLGIVRPLSRVPIVVIVDCLVLILVWFAARRHDPIDAALDSLPSSQLLICGLLGALPLAAIAGAGLLNNGSTSHVAIATAAISTTVLVGLMMFGRRGPAVYLPVGLFAVALAAAWAYSMRSSHLFGFDIQQEIQAFNATMRPAAWSIPRDGNPYAAMLSITALPALLAQVSGVSGVMLFKVVYPLLFALVPVVVYEVAARWAPRAAAFGAAALTIALPQFAGQLPAIARQEIALLIFATMIAFAFDTTISIRIRKTALLVGAVGLSVAHYSTAYATVAALVIAHFVYEGVRFWRNHEHHGVLTFRIVLVFAAVVLVWNVVITDSSQNLSLFVRNAKARGAEILPNARDGSLTDRWLTGNTVKPIGAYEFYGRAKGYYVDQNRFLNFYPRELQQQYPPVDTKVQQNAEIVPGVKTVTSLLRISTTQLMLVFTGVGTIWFLWKRRTNTVPVLTEFAALAIAFLSFLAFMRVSGVAAEAYNQERAQLHAAVLLSVGLATTLGWGMHRYRRTATAFAALVVGVTFAASAGLTSLVGGGDISPTLANRGEAYERFVIADAERSAARWLDAHRQPKSIIFTDRYGKLRLWGSSQITSVFDSATPGTIDRGAFVFASRTNVVERRGRGQINEFSGSYRFPLPFLDRTKSVLYANTASRIYR